MQADKNRNGSFISFFLIVLFLLGAESSAARKPIGRRITTKDERALPAAAALVSAAGSHGASALGLLARLQPPATKSFNLTDGASNEDVDGELLDELAAFLAQESAAEALQAAAADGDERLAALLDDPPFNRTMRCEEAAGGNLTAQVVDCYCDGVLPWPTCDAMLHLELRRAWAGVRASAKAPASPRRRPSPGPRPGGRRLQQYAYCDGLSTFFSFDTSTGGCISGYCEAGIVGVGSVYGELQGCAYAVSIPPGYLSGSDVGEVCGSDGCYDWTMSELADYMQSSFIVDASIGGRVGVCLSLFGLQDLLSWFGFTDAFCQQVEGTWYPLRGQVSVGGKVSLGWSIAGLWVELEGTLQYMDAADNPMCALGELNDWWWCQDFCNWYAGDGYLIATAGWDFLWWGDASTATVIDSWLPAC